MPLLSVVTMALSCIVCQIQRLIGRKSQNLYTTLVFIAPAGGDPVGIQRRCLMLRVVADCSSFNVQQLHVPAPCPSSCPMSVLISVPCRHWLVHKPRWLQDSALAVGQHAVRAGGRVDSRAENGIVRRAGKSIIHILLQGHQMSASGLQLSSSLYHVAFSYFYRPIRTFS